MPNWSIDYQYLGLAELAFDALNATSGGIQIIVGLFTGLPSSERQQDVALDLPQVIFTTWKPRQILYQAGGPTLSPR